MKDIPGYEGLYAATSCGKIWSYKRKQFLKGRDNGHGYLKVYLSNRKCFFIHRLVAMTYLTNPNNLSDVNHRDGNIRNNALTNLEWTSHQENVLKGNKTKPIYGYKSIKDYASAIGMNYSTARYKLQKGLLKPRA